MKGLVFMVIRDESYDRMYGVIEDIGCCCETDDDFNEWEDTAASCISDAFEELNADQIENTGAAFREYITEIADEHKNLSRGLRAAFIRSMTETLEFIGEYTDEEIADIDEYDLADENVQEELAVRKAFRRELELAEKIELD